jgi:uncharacterized protein
MRVISIKVRPMARQSQLTPQTDGTFLAQLKAAPVDGKANAELIALVAQHFGVGRAAVSIKSGAGARIKRVQILQ